MSSVQRRDTPGAVTSPLSRLDRIFDEWMRTLSMNRPVGMPWDLHGEDVISVDEYRDEQTQVIRAELPGIDPAKDVELTVTDGMLRIAAERRVEQDTEDKGFRRHEMRYGQFSRTLPIPEGASADDITATYKDGILEVRIPVPPPPVDAPPTRIEISRG